MLSWTRPCAIERCCADELGLDSDESAFEGAFEGVLFSDAVDCRLRCGTVDFLSTDRLGLGRFLSIGEDPVRRLLRSLEPIVSRSSSPPS